jgi:lysophospholipase L1-like esterase
MTQRISDLLASPEPLRWLFTGDSITHGAKHTWGERDFVELFAERLRTELGRRRDHVITTAISGRRIGDLEGDLEWSLLQYRPHIVSIMFGLNDCATTSPDVAGFTASYLRVIDAAIEQGAAIILHTPNRQLITETPERLANLPAFVDAVRAIAEARDVLLVDHYAAWAAADENGEIEFWINHGCHPNGVGHRAMNRVLLERLGLWDAASDTGKLLIPGTLPETPSGLQ